MLSLAACRRLRTLALPLLPALVLLGRPAPAAADQPLPPPARHSVSSASGRVLAVSDPQEGLTTVTVRGDDGSIVRTWSMPGWYRAIHVADDGEHLVLGFDGLNLLPVSAQADLVLLRFVRRGEVLRVARLRDLVPDPRALRRTASHLLWREAQGFHADGTFVVVTVDGATHRFDPTTGLAPGAPPPAGASDLDRLCGWLAGTFARSAGAAAGPGGPAAGVVTLHSVPVWPARRDGRWFYVEQGRAGAPGAPELQRVQRVRDLGDGLFEVRVHDLPDPPAAAGAWREQAPLARLAPEALVPRPGCGLVLRRVGPDAFAGSTLGAQCAGALPGLAYITRELTVTAQGLRTWERGYDAAGQQVWGPSTGPEELRRR